MPDDRKVVTDKQYGNIRFLQQQLDETNNCRLRRNIKRTHGLIEYDEFRREDHGPRNTDTLTFPSTKFVRVSVDKIFSEMNLTHDLTDFLFPLSLAELGVEYSQWLANDFSHRHCGIMARQWILKNDLQILAHCIHFVFR